MAQACNPSTLGGRGGSRDQDHPGQHGETPSLLKIRKISWAWWCTPVVPATREAEAGELLEPRRRRLQWAEIMPLHSSLGNNSETLSQKNKNKNKKYIEEEYNKWWLPVQYNGRVGIWGRTRSYRSKSTKLQLCWRMSGGVVYSIRTIVNTVVYIGNLLKE